MIRSLDTILSLEIVEKLNIYKALLNEWNRRTTLVQEDTLREFDQRHVFDSLQLIPIIHEIYKLNISKHCSEVVIDFSSMEAKESPFDDYIDMGFRLDQPPESIKDLIIIDVGTGAGLPGMILSICGFSSVTLCESNLRKCIFLEEVARQTNTTVTILNQRVEIVTEKYDIVLSRACSSLEELLQITNTLSKDNNTYGLFHKGRSWVNEVNDAQKNWDFKKKIYNSITTTDGVIVGCFNLKKR
jgi:16S rRNA (guanine527-N7)-methyltransferase